jgi:hypothetical protein
MSINNDDIAKIRKALHYNPKTGHFTRIHPKNPRLKHGERAGSFGTIGYRTIGVINTSMMEGRLAYIFMTGKLPKHNIYYADGNRLNVAWSNISYNPAVGVLTQYKLKLVLRLDYDDGKFYWKQYRGGVSFPGAAAGSFDHCNGTQTIHLYGRPQRGHRLAWLYHHGKLPKGQVICIDGDYRNLRPSNLVTAKGTGCHYHCRYRSANVPVNPDTMGGVTQDPITNKYKAVCNFDGYKYLGTYDTRSEAQSAREKYARRNGVRI